MKVCYLVLAHAQPRHLRRLCKALTSDGSSAVVHVDGKSNLDTFVFDMPNVTFLLSRICVNWGGWSIVEATLRLMASAREVAPHADYYWLVSGDSYPLRPERVLRKVIETVPNREFLNLLEMGSPRGGKKLSNISNYYIEFDPRTSRPSTRLFFSVAHRVMRRPYVSRLAGRIPYGGSQWFTLSASATDFVLKVWNSEKRLVELAKTSRIPDEFFMQTILGNSPFADRIVPALFFADFRPKDVATPVELGPRQIMELGEMPGGRYSNEYGEHVALMGRKFTDAHPEVVDLVEEHLWNLDVNISTYVESPLGGAKPAK